MALLSRSARLLNRGPWGPTHPRELVLATASYLQLTQPVCVTELYNSLSSTYFLWVSHLHPIQPVQSQGYTPIASTGCTCYLHWCISYLTAQPRVNMQQSSHNYFSKFHMWNFSSRSSPPPHTHILQINLRTTIAEKKNTKRNYLNHSKNKILIRRRPFPYVTLVRLIII